MRALRPCLCLLGSLALAGLATPAGAQAVGEEFQVNTYTTSSQSTYLQTRAVAADASGNFVVVWSSFAQDGSLRGVFGQRYDSDGQALGTEFQVNSFTSNAQERPSVAAAADGDFVVVWDGSGPGDSFQGIFGQRFDSTGQALGNEFKVNSYTPASQLFPAIASDAAGNFVVTWQCSTTYGTCGIRGQRFDSQGVAQGGEFLVTNDVYPGGPQPEWGDVASDASGNFVVVWYGSNQDGPGGIFGQRYDSAGEALGTKFRVNPHTEGGVGWAPSVASDGSGNFVVVWLADDQHRDSYGVFGRRFDAAGSALGPEFRVNSYTTGDQEYASVASDDSGNFTVVWTSNGQDGDLHGVFGQRYDSAGVAQGAEFQVNSFTTSNQKDASVASDDSGNFIVVWTSFGQSGTSHDVFGRRFAFGGADSIMVVSPNTNVKWRIGSLRKIKWTHSLGRGSTFRIEVDRNDDGTYEELIAAAAAADSDSRGTFAWTVTGPPSGTARVRVSWTDDPSVSDASDTTFQIRP